MSTDNNAGTIQPTPDDPSFPDYAAPVSPVNRSPEGTPIRSERFYHDLVNQLPDVIFVLDDKGRVILVNEAISHYGYRCGDILGRPMLDFVFHKDREHIFQSFQHVFNQAKSQSLSEQFRIVTGEESVRWVEANCVIRFSPEGRFLLQEGVCRDITDRVLAQNAMLKTQDELEELIHIRTSELTRANIDLKKEIEERRDTETMLRQREKELEMEKFNLEETNTALKVLLKRREMDKRALEEQVMYNVKKLLLPYVEKLNNKLSNQQRQAYLGIIKTNLNDIINPFSRRISIEFFNLTNAEIKVANFIRQGKKNRDVAELLGISVRTVEAYRLAIRRKLRIHNKKINLRTFLLSID